MPEIRQWWDVVEQLRTERLSRMLRRRVERWLFGRRAEPGADLAGVAVQAEAAFLRGSVAGEDLLPALLALGLGAGVLAAREDRSSPAALWQASVRLIGRRLAFDVHSERPEAAGQLREQADAARGDRVLAPVFAETLAWLDAARASTRMGLGRVPGLLLLEDFGQGLIADVAVLLQRGALPREQLGLRLELGAPDLHVHLSPSFMRAVAGGLLLGLAAQDGVPAASPARTDAAGQGGVPEAAPWRILGGETLVPLLGPEASMALASPRIRELWQEGTRIDLAVGAGGLTHLDGHSLAVAVAVAAHAAATGREYGTSVPWDTALSGGLDPHGRLLGVGGLNGKTAACLQSRVKVVVGPEENRAALRELQARVGDSGKLQLTSAASLRQVLALGRLGVAAAAGRRPLQRRLQAWMRTAAAVALSTFAAIGPLGRLLGLAPPAPEPPRVAKTSALVTWPSEDSQGRLAPDGRRFSFVSNRGGGYDVWIQDLDGHEATQITRSDGKIFRTAWSADGSEIACLVRRGDGVWLEIAGAADGEVRLREKLELPSPDLVRWLGARVYLEAESALWAFDLEASQLREVYSHPELKYTNGFDLSADARQIVFSAARDGRWDLWTVTLGGGKPKQLTDDAATEGAPFWVEAGRGSVVYESDATGQRELWQLSLADGTRRQLTVSSEDERLQDVSRDGSRVLFWKMHDSANLHALDLGSGAEQQLTADSLSEIWPSASRDARLVAFQRKDPDPSRASSLGEWRLFLGGSGTGSLAEAVLSVADGYAPRVSPDGRWMAWLRPPAEISSRPRLFWHPELWASELPSGAELRIAERIHVAGFWSFPLELASYPAWSADSRWLFFAASTPDGGLQLVRSAFPPSPDRLEPLASVPAGSQLRDLIPSADGGLVGYILRTGAGREELRLLDTGSRVDRQVLGELGSTLYARGWTADGSILVLGARTAQDRTAHLDILKVHPSGPVLPLGSGQGAIPLTARFDPHGGRLFLTRLRNGRHELAMFELARREWSVLATGSQPGETFSGIVPLADGRLLFSRQRQHKDLWQIRLEPDRTPSGRAGSP
jgi:Tol biopolymer transport system component